MNYTVNNGQTLFDVAINTIVNLNNLYSFLQSNKIPNITVNPIGYSIEFTPPPITPPIVVSAPMNKTITEKTFTSIPGQSVYDIVLQNYGDINLTYKIIQDSNFSNVLNYPVPQTLFTFNPTLVRDAVFASYLSKNNLIINTVSNNQEISPSGFLQTASGIDLLDADGNNLQVA